MNFTKWLNQRNNLNASASARGRGARPALALLIATFFLWTLLFMLEKPVFLLAYGGIGHVAVVVWHGLPLDLSMAGYLTAVPALLMVVFSLPFKTFHTPKAARWLRIMLALYFLVSSLAVALSFVANLALYAYWRFPLDSTPIFFLTSSFHDTMASIEWWQALAALAAIGVVAGVVGGVFHLLYRPNFARGFAPASVRSELLLVVLTAALFLPIRGGVTVSSMNTGRAYFSQDQLLNHAAVNPLFSFMESMTHQEDFAHQYRFMDDGEAHRFFRRLGASVKTDSAHVSVLQQPFGAAEKPDIYLIILESFSDTLTHVAGVTPQLNSLKQQGTYFSRFYANGFRTDRGLVSVLLGYPAPGAVSLMKYPRKTSRLPSLAGHLKQAGYGLHYYYGGDADFTNMRSFLVNQGFEDITEDVDFPVADRLSKWGVPDHLLFSRAERDISHRHARQPQLTVIQTSSSHEPFDVPYHHLAEKRLNAFAYADSCVGAFVRFLKATPQWRRSLVIIVPDHLGAWPDAIDNFASWRFHVPMVWVGGAVAPQRFISTYGSQQDIAATVLGQLGIGHGDMPFSKDMLDPRVNHYAYFMPNDGFGMISSQNELIFDNKQHRVIVDKGRRKGANLKPGQALLQVLFDDIASK